MSFVLDTQARHFRMHFSCNNNVGVAEKVSLKLSVNITRQNELRGQWNTVQHVECPGDWSAEEVEPGSSLIFTLQGDAFHGNGTQMFKVLSFCLGYLPLSPL